MQWCIGLQVCKCTVGLLLQYYIILLRNAFDCNGIPSAGMTSNMQKKTNAHKEVFRNRVLNITVETTVILVYLQANREQFVQCHMHDVKLNCGEKLHICDSGYKRCKLTRNNCT